MEDPFGHKQRIELVDTPVSAVMKLAEGNPGAITVCGQILKQGEAIDPDGLLGGIGALLSLDTIGLYGPNIWVLYKDQCGQNIAKLLAVLRAVQLGFIGAEEVVAASADRGDSALDIPALYAKVKEFLPRFDPTGLGRYSQ